MPACILCVYLACVYPVCVSCLRVSCVCILFSTHTFTHTHTHACTRTHPYTQTHTNTTTHTQTHLHTHAHIFSCATNIYTHSHMCMCVCVFVYIWFNISSPYHSEARRPLVKGIYSYNAIRTRPTRGHGVSFIKIHYFCGIGQACRLPLIHVPQVRRVSFFYGHTQSKDVNAAWL